MASISKEKRSGRYRVLIRKRGLPTGFDGVQRIEGGVSNLVFP